LFIARVKAITSAGGTEDLLITAIEATMTKTIRQSRHAYQREFFDFMEQVSAYIGAKIAIHEAPNEEDRRVAMKELEDSLDAAELAFERAVTACVNSR
jgi:hypothetical protein